MFYVYFIIAVLIIAWLMNRSHGQKISGAVNQGGDPYAQGYWDGYRARQKEVEAGIETPQHADYLFNESVGVFSVAEEAKPKEPVLSEAELKAKHDMQNINTALYIACLLLVAAVALFIGASLSESVRFLGVWAVAIGFYFTGLYLHRNFQKLRPAAVAFTGTGLAILPFTGIAMYNFILHDAPICWFLTSLIGVLAFIYTAVRLKNQVVSYFAIAFIISLSASSVSTLGVGLIWYFVVLILVGSLFSIVATIRPKWLPEYFNSPIQQSNFWIVPLTLVASLFACNHLKVIDYSIITLTSAIYYGAVAASSLDKRDISIFLARFMFSLSMILLAHDIFDDWVMVGLTVSAIGILQVAVSTMFLPKYTAGDQNNEVWLWLGFGMQLAAPLFATDSSSWGIIVLGQLFSMLIMSIGVAYALRRMMLTAFGTVALAFIPIIWGLEVAKPHFEVHFVSLIFIALALLVILVNRMVENFSKLINIDKYLFVNVFLFIVEALIYTSHVEPVWGFTISSLSAAMIYYLVYIKKQPWMIIIANLITLLVGGWLFNWLGFDAQWSGVFIAWFAFVVFYLAHLLMESLSRNYYGLFFWWSAIASGIAFNVFSLFRPDDSVAGFASAGMAGAALILAAKGWSLRKYYYVDAGVIIATIGLQRIVDLMDGNLDTLLYTHWWALTIAMLGLMYYGINDRVGAKNRLIIALVFITIPSGLAALASGLSHSDVPYRLIFIMEHIIMLLAGLVTSKKMVTIWGAVGITLAVMLLLQDYTYMLLATVAFIIIGATISTMNRQSKN